MLRTRLWDLHEEPFSLLQNELLRNSASPHILSAFKISLPALTSLFKILLVFHLGLPFLFTNLPSDYSASCFILFTLGPENSKEYFASASSVLCLRLRTSATPQDNIGWTQGLSPVPRDGNNKPPKFFTSIKLKSVKNKTSHKMRIKVSYHGKICLIKKKIFPLSTDKEKNRKILAFQSNNASSKLEILIKYCSYSFILICHIFIL